MFRFPDEEMDVFGHDDVGVDVDDRAKAHGLEGPNKDGACLGVAEQGCSAAAAEGDEMQVT